MMKYTNVQFGVSSIAQSIVGGHVEIRNNLQKLKVKAMVVVTGQPERDGGGDFGDNWCTLLNTQLFGKGPASL